MKATVVEATAPCRVDLAGGALDVWPLYLFHPGAVTVTVAIDRRAWCRVETGVAGVHLESKDSLQKAEGKNVSDLLGHGGLSLVAHILHSLGIETGVRVTTQAKVPTGAGLGGSSALATAVAGAAARATGRDLAPTDLWPTLRDVETQCLGIPRGVQDYLTAIHGGVLAVHLDPGAVRVERLETDPGRVEESLILVDSGVTRSPGLNNWGLLKGQGEGSPRVGESLAAIASAARRVRQALVSACYEEVGALLVEEWEARKRLEPGVTTPEIDRIAEVAAAAGGGAKVCGAGGGGLVAVWATPGERSPGTRERVEAALRAAGFRSFPVRVDLLGLELE
jgi:D-glycero-alpha-D-manno-heptose-7-phosphate kinase